VHSASHKRLNVGTAGHIPKGVPHIDRYTHLFIISDLLFISLVADHLVQSFIRFAGASYGWYDNVRSGTVRDRYEGLCGERFKWGK